MSFNITTVLNNREIAILIWLTVFVLWVLLQSSLRKSLHDLIKTFFNPKLFLPLMLMVFYAGILVYLLYALGFWNASQLKTTILWLFFTAFVFFFKLDKADDKRFFSRAIIKTIKVVVIVEYVAYFYSLPLVIEIFIVPLILFTTSLLVVSGTDQKNKNVEKLATIIMTLFGVFLLGYFTIHLWSDPQTFFNVNTVKDIILPPILTIALIPFLYLLAVAIKYQFIFLLVRLPEGDSNLVWHFRKKLFYLFNFNIARMSIWTPVVLTENITTKEDVDALSAKIKKAIALNKKKEIIVACSCLEDFGLKPGVWKPISKDEYGCSSPYKKIGNDLLISNNLAYYVQGKPDQPEQYELLLNVFYSSDTKAAHFEMRNVAVFLVKKVFGFDLPSSIIHAIENGVEAKGEIADVILDLTRFEWPTGKGYELKLKASRLDRSD